ncbi:YetF domain-containing protein [uncultured Methylibium sp.]|uniref:DUF421 domain-containing protein n=1 Tax=uncultured Methylibium sp. TaxID=381093 RepID=UPI0025DFA3F7|nr:YetF domain-containing protein [uncultured Methylibium sp.]
MFELSMPWWEFPVRAALIYGVLLLLIRVSGKRTVGQFTPFDLLVVMLLSESVSNGLSGGDDSVTGGLLAAASLILLNVVVAVGTARSSGFQQLVEGRAVLIGRDGQLFDDVLRKSNVPRLDVERALREADCDLKDMQCAFLEADGRVSILKESAGAVTEANGLTHGEPKP